MTKGQTMTNTKKKKKTNRKTKTNWRLNPQPQNCVCFSKRITTTKTKLAMRLHWAKYPPNHPSSVMIAWIFYIRHFVIWKLSSDIGEWVHILQKGQNQFLTCCIPFPSTLRSAQCTYIHSDCQQNALRSKAHHFAKAFLWNFLEAKIRKEAECIK